MRKILFGLSVSCVSLTGVPAIGSDFNTPWVHVTNDGLRICREVVIGDSILLVAQTNNIKPRTLAHVLALKDRKEYVFWSGDMKEFLKHCDGLRPLGLVMYKTKQGEEK